MSYRNPQQFIDRQSGQAYVDLIKTTIGIGEDMAKRARDKAKANELKNNRLIKDREKSILKLRTEFYKNAGSNFNPGDWEPKIQEYDTIQQKIDNGTATPEDKQKQAEILAMPSTGKTLGENLYSSAKSIDNSINNAGQPGGLDLKGTDPEALKNSQIFLGKITGNKAGLDFVDGDVAVKIGEQHYTQSGINKFLENQLGAEIFGRIIPNETSNFESAKDFSLMPNPDDPTDPDKRVINPAYLTDIQKREEKNGDITYYRAPNKQLLRKPGNPVGAELRANAASLLEMPDNSAVSMWNNTLDNKGVDWDYDEILTDEQKSAFIEAYVDHGLGPKYFTQETIERVEKAPKPEKPTATERKETKSAKESKTNYNIAKKLINQEGKIPDVPAQPNFFDVSGQLTREGNRFKEALSTIVTGSNGKLVEFVESERTGDPSARVKYPGQPEIEISLAEFRNKDLFDAKIQKATGSGTSGLETYYDINLD